MSTEINYELAKKLKDAGFPQNTEFYFIDDEYEIAERKDTGETIDGEWGSCRDIKDVECVASPTLSELIEACGDGDFALKSRTDTTFDGTKEWFAGILDKGHASGSTPQEAVAALWLSLNKK